MSAHWNLFENNNILRWEDVDSNFFALLKGKDDKLSKLVEAKLRKLEQNTFEDAVKQLR